MISFVYFRWIILKSSHDVGLPINRGFSTRNCIWVMSAVLCSGFRCKLHLVSVSNRDDGFVTDWYQFGR